jgi:hypothetical protein
VARVRLTACALFGERAVQIAGDRSSDLRHLEPLVVLRVEKMRREIPAQGALAAERDHGARSIIFRSAARMTASSSQATTSASAASLSPPATRAGVPRASSGQPCQPLPVPHFRKLPYSRSNENDQP